MTSQRSAPHRVAAAKYSEAVRATPRRSRDTPPVTLGYLERYRRCSSVLASHRPVASHSTSRARLW
jgi:hypothetical protein